MTKKHGNDNVKIGHWIEEENLNYQAKKIRARINETAQIAETNFWEYISGSFPEVTNLHRPNEVMAAFTQSCRDAVAAWYIANSELDEKLRGLITSEVGRKES